MGNVTFLDNNPFPPRPVTGYSRQQLKDEAIRLGLRTETDVNNNLIIHFPVTEEDPGYCLVGSIISTWYNQDGRPIQTMRVTKHQETQLFLYWYDQNGRLTMDMSVGVSQASSLIHKYVYAADGSYVEELYYGITLFTRFFFAPNGKQIRTEDAFGKVTYLAK